MLHDVETDTITRLAIFMREVEGVKGAVEQPPANTLTVGEMPLFYFMVGPMLERAPAGTPGHVYITREFVARLVIDHYAGANTAQGNHAAVAALPFYSRLRRKFVLYPRLSTVGMPSADPPTSPLPEYGPLWRDVWFQDSGLIPQMGPGGVRYAVIDWRLTLQFNLTIPESDLS